jgi:hypothetical protein
MSVDGTGKIYISWKEWTDFVTEFAPFLKNAQFIIGPPIESANGVEVDYAFGDEVHPKEWIVQPEWLQKRDYR